MHARLLLSVATALVPVLALPLEKRAVAYYSPLAGGGSMLDDTLNGYGEPLNVIISGESSPDVLTYNGFINFVNSIGFAEECLDIHLGDPFPANLGDGNGWVNQTIEMRQDYGSVGAGTCLESLIGGNHLRMWQQTGPDADSNAFFLAVSEEENVTTDHTIAPNGYDNGRNNLAASAIGTTSYNGVTYSTTAYNVTGLLPVGTAGINHDIAIDGIVTVLTVTIQ